LEASRNHMRKNITPERIINNDVKYSLEDFFKELWKDVEASISKDDFAHISNSKERSRQYKESVREVFNFVYEICLEAAIKAPRLKRILNIAGDEEKNIIEKTIKSYKNNIEILHAIFVRDISAETEKDLTKRQAVKIVVERSKNRLIHFLRDQTTSKRK
jgi:Glu-tRNA(Gln) amidotransferase subunit E-like FAD-binding protein